MDESFLRIVFFLTALTFFIVWEFFYPRVRNQIPKNIRWQRNFAISLFGMLCTRIVIPVSSFSLCLYAQTHQIGLFNHFLTNPVIAIALSIILLDLVIYIQHFLTHHIAFLWRFHKIHHIDQEIDVTTGLRFHPIELIFSQLIKFSCILILGIPATAYLIFEILFNLSAMFIHSNLTLPKKIDSLLRLVIITPDVHRIHHSIYANETNSNFGTSLSVWDKLFKTYKDKAKASTENIKIGLKEYQAVEKTNFIELLKTPFIKKS